MQEVCAFSLILTQFSLYHCMKREINLVSDVFPRGKMNWSALFESLQSCNSNGVFITIRRSKHRELISSLMTALNYNEYVSPWANERQCNHLIMWSFVSLPIITVQSFTCWYIKVKIFCPVFSFFKFITRSLGTVDCTYFEKQMLQVK